MSGTPIATGRKGPQEAVRPPAQRRKADATPLPGTAVRGRLDGSPTGEERGPTASETGAYEVEHRVGGEFSPHGFIAVPDNLRVKRKKSPAVISEGRGRYRQTRIWTYGLFLVCFNERFDIVGSDIDAVVSVGFWGKSHV